MAGPNNSDVNPSLVSASAVESGSECAITDNVTAQKGLIIAKGDSVTDDGNQNRPGLSSGVSYFNESLPLLDHRVSADNLGWNGTRLGKSTEEGTNNWLWQVQTDIIEKFDCIPDGKPKIVTVSLGNTLHDFDPTPTSGNGTARLYFDQIRRSHNNIKVVLVDSNPRGLEGGGRYEQRRVAVEEWAKTHVGIDFDAFVSFRNLSEDAGENASLLNESLFPPDDHIHPTARWHEIVAREAMAPVLNNVLSQFDRDTNGPVPVRYSPLPNKLGRHGKSDSLTVRFDEHVKLTRKAEVLLLDQNNKVVDRVHSENLSAHGVDLDIRFNHRLMTGKTYSLEIAPGSLTDVHGNLFAGTTQAETWRVPSALFDSSSFVFLVLFPLLCLGGIYLAARKKSYRS